MRETAAADHDIALSLASFYAMEGLVDQGIEWLERSVRLGNENYPLLAGSAKLDSLRRDPRYVQLMADLKRLWEERRGDNPAGDAAKRE